MAKEQAMTSIDSELKELAKKKGLNISECCEEGIKNKLQIANIEEGIEKKCHFCGLNGELEWACLGNFVGYICKKCIKKEIYFIRNREPA
jgi:hypothetical protein